jgi:hypothetical protein
VKQNHKPVQENCTNKRSSKSCGAEIKLTHKLELMKILRINPNIDSSSGLIKDEDKEPTISKYFCSRFRKYMKGMFAFICNNPN